MTNVDSIKISSKLAKLMTDVIETHVKEHTNNILETLCKDYNLDVIEVKQKYGSIPPIIELGKNKKKSNMLNNDNKTSEPKKRGRKKKQKEELIETEEYEFNGNTYLIDADNNAYTYNIEQPVFVGTKLIDGRIKFIQ
jgi:REP element-mobilizing transposase RayT